MSESRHVEVNVNKWSDGRDAFGDQVIFLLRVKAVYFVILLTILDKTAV